MGSNFRRLYSISRQSMKKVTGLKKFVRDAVSHEFRNLPKNYFVPHPKVFWNSSMNCEAIKGS